MHLSEINIYPVKSLKGISLDSADVEPRGLRFDRRWMLMDEKNRFLTQREIPQMATLAVEIGSDSLQITVGEKSLSVPFECNSEAEEVEIWNSRCAAQIYDGEPARWFSDVLGVEVRLALLPVETKRRVNPVYTVGTDDHVSFADGYPFMLLGEGSLEDLNSRLDKPLPMNRFRPNFVVEGSEPFAEDGWKKIRIGETVFHVVKPSERCVITTIDQSKGEKIGKEPLKTLGDFRQKDGKILFGQNLIAENPGGAVRVGDEIEMLA